MKRITITDNGEIPDGECILNHKDAKICLTCKNCVTVPDSVLGQPKAVLCETRKLEKDILNIGELENGR